MGFESAFHSVVCWSFSSIRWFFWVAFLSRGDWVSFGCTPCAGSWPGSVESGLSSRFFCLGVLLSRSIFPLASFPFRPFIGGWLCKVSYADASFPFCFCLVDLLSFSQVCPPLLGSRTVSFYSDCRSCVWACRLYNWVRSSGSGLFVSVVMWVGGGGV